MSNPSVLDLPWEREHLPNNNLRTTSAQLLPEFFYMCFSPEPCSQKQGDGGTLRVKALYFYGASKRAADHGKLVLTTTTSNFTLYKFPTIDISH